MTESRIDISGALGRICLLTSNFPRWPQDATTPFVLHLAQDLQALGWAVEVLAPHAPGAARREVLDGVPVRRFRYLWPAAQQTVCYQGGALSNLRTRRTNWLKLPLLVFFEWLALMALLARGRHDLIHAHWILPQGFVAVAGAWMFRIPVVITAHGSDVFGLRGWPMAWFKRFALRRAAAVTVNSSATEAEIPGAVPGGMGRDRGPAVPGLAALRLLCRVSRARGPGAWRTRCRGAVGRDHHRRLDRSRAGRRHLLPSTAVALSGARLRHLDPAAPVGSGPGALTGPRAGGVPDGLVWIESWTGRDGWSMRRWIMNRNARGPCPGQNTSRGADIAAAPTAPWRGRGFAKPACGAILDHGHK